MDYVQPLVTLITGVPIAVLTSWITVKLALKRFQAEKLYERRLDAYTKAIEAMHLMKHCLERQLSAVKGSYQIPKATEEVLMDQYKTGLADVRRYADIGVMLFSHPAVDHLQQLITVVDTPRGDRTQIQRTEFEFNALQQCLTRLREDARGDLGE